MIDVMVVDDEIMLRSAVLSLLKWEDHGFSFVAEARDGLEALAMLKKHPSIQIILLDIFMPNMDGLEFLEKLQGMENRPAVIVLSANDHFLSVRKAFKLGVSDYILKYEIDEETLLGELKKVSLTLNLHDRRKKQQNLPSSRFSSRENNDNEAVFQLLMEDLVHGRNTSLTIQLARDIKIPFSFPCRLILFWVDFPENILDSSQIDQQHQIVFLKAKKYLDQQGEGWVQLLSESVLVFYLNLSDQERMDGELESFCKDFQDQIKISMNLYSSFTLSGICTKAEDIPEGFSYARSLKSTESRIVRSAKRYIKKNFNKADLSLEDVSQLVEVSRTHLSAQFKKECGFTFWEYLTRCRIDAAIGLLADTNLRIYEVSEQVGYPNVEHFSRVFKKMTGKSPRQYVQNNND